MNCFDLVAQQGGIDGFSAWPGLAGVTENRFANDIALIGLIFRPSGIHKTSYHDAFPMTMLLIGVNGRCQ